mgnify:CR=1 FL=1
MVENREVLDAIYDVGNRIFEKLTGSQVWRFDGQFIQENFNISGIPIELKIKDAVKADGTPILPQDAISQDLLNNGSYLAIVEINLPNEKKFSIQAPHNKPENQFHLQKGREKIFIPIQNDEVATYGNLCSGLFFKFDNAVEYIKQIREL